MARYAIHHVVSRYLVGSALVLVGAIHSVLAQDFTLVGADVVPSACSNVIARTDVGADLHIPLRRGRTHLIQSLRQVVPRSDLPHSHQ